MTANHPAAAEIVERARALAPRLFSRAEEAEQSRHCPRVSVDDWFASGLDLAHKPARFGGSELGWDVLCETGLALSQGCAAQGWVLTVYGDHTQALGMFPRQAQDDVWDDPRALISTSFAAMGKARKVTGGAVLSAKWAFSSGIDHATWVMAGSVLADGDNSAAEARTFLLPKSDVAVVDDWHVMGLAGTGSKSFTVDEIFIPEHRMINAIAPAEGCPHPQSGNRAPVFYTPRRSTAGLALASVCVGAAKGLLDEFVRTTRDRLSQNPGANADQWLQVQISEASAMLRAAELLILTDARATMARFAEGGQADIVLRANDKRDAGFAALIARQATDRLYGIAGGHSLQVANPMQRYFRDVHAATAHFGLRWEHSAIPYARLALGLEPGPGYY